MKKIITIQNLIIAFFLFLIATPIMQTRNASEMQTEREQEFLASVETTEEQKTLLEVISYGFNTALGNFSPAVEIGQEVAPYVAEVASDVWSQVSETELAQNAIVTVRNSDFVRNTVGQISTDISVAVVENVVDGDTIDVVFENGSTERVRFIGIDTPERGQPGFNEATARVAELINANDNVVYLTTEGRNRDNTPSQRLRRHVFVGDTHLGCLLVAEGHATIRTVGNDTPLVCP